MSGGLDASGLIGFQRWIVANGGEVLPTTSQWEVIRYTLPEDGVCVVYVNKAGKQRWIGATAEHRQLFDAGKPARVHKRPTGADAKRTLRQALVERDGDWCWYCQMGGGATDLTLEHILSIKHGGSNHIGNLALACVPCNTEVGSKPVVEKVAFHARARECYRLGLNIHEDQTAPDYVPWIEPAPEGEPA